MHNITLIRGLGRDAFHWGEFIPLLQKAFPNSKIFTADLLGNGVLYDQDSSPHLHDHLRALRLQLPFLKKKEPTFLIGISLGAMVSAHWASLLPEEITGLVLINTSFADFPLHLRIKPKALLKLFAMAGQRDPYLREKAIIELTAHQCSDVSALAQKWGDRAREKPVKVKNILNQLLLATRLNLPPEKPPMPVLVLNGEKDQMVAPECSVRVAQLWKTDLYQHPNAGHDLAVDDSPWIVESIKNWVNQDTKD